MILLYFLRYFSVINLNSMKNNFKVISENKETGEKIEKISIRIKILKLLSQVWFITILLFIFYLFSLILFTII